MSIEILRLLTEPGLQRLVMGAPKAAALYQTARRAAQGDRAAIEALKREGWAEALDLLQPGAGAAARQAVDAVNAMRGTTVEGEWREVEPESERYPWQGFADWLRRRHWGAFVILGPKGSGKTVAGLRFAEIWHEATHWPVEVVNVYPDDVPDFVRRISAKRFAARLQGLAAYLDIDDYSDEDAEPDTERADVIDIDALRRRIVVVDEASLIGTNLGRQKGRDMMQAIMAQARHLEWLIVYIAQTTKMLPLSLLGTADAVIVKRPSGGEGWTDRPDTPEVEQLWQRTAQAFADLRGSPYFAMAGDHRRWAYVEVSDLGAGRPWRGMVPLKRPGEDAE